MQRAPPVASSTTVHRGVDDKIARKMNGEIANKTKGMPTAAIVAPTTAARGALKWMGQARARYPSIGLVIVATKNVNTNSPVATKSTEPLDPPIATMKISQAVTTIIGPSRRNIRVLFIEVDPSLSLPPSALAGTARHRLGGPHIASSRTGRFNRMPSPVDVVRQQRAHAHRQQQEKAGANCAVHDL